MSKQNKLFGEELKKLMIEGVLPDEYISEDNLNALLDYEYGQMGDNEYYDMSVIKYCSSLIAKNYTDENYEKRKWETFEKIKEQIGLIEMPLNDESVDKSVVADKPNRKRSFLPLKISAACIAVLIGVQIISFATVGINFFDITRSTFFALLGITIQQDDITQIALGARIYESVEEFEAAEGIRILVPMWLPSDLEIEFITYSHTYDGGGRIYIEYDDGMTILIIELNANIPDIDGVMTYSEIYKYNDIMFYVFRDANIIGWEYNGNFYNLALGFDVSEYVEKIIENIK